MNTSRARHSLVTYLCFAVLMSGPVEAQQTSKAQQTDADSAAAKAKPESRGKVCEYEQVTGSRMKKRVCYTAEQWASRQHAAQSAVREIDGKPVGTAKDD